LIPECKEHVMPTAIERETRQLIGAPPAALSGRWLIDAQESHARFVASTLGGLVGTPGRFRSLSGNLVADGGRAGGELVIDPSSIDTGNRLRDRHLRSRGFFDVRRHPQLRYHAHAISSRGPGAARIEGQLTLADSCTPLALDVSVRAPSEGVVELACRTEVDRVALGIRGARGVVPRAVQLDLQITLRRVVA
jgi:polyisoprenoid-binding protein YceI